MITPSVEVDVGSDDATSVCAALRLSAVVEGLAFPQNTTTGLFELERQSGTLASGALFTPFNASKSELSGKTVVLDAAVVTSEWRAERRLSVTLR